MKLKDPARFARLAGAAGLLLALGACASLSGKPAPPDYAGSMAIAQTHADTGQVEAAVAALSQAAALEPAHKEPWLRIAQLRAAQNRHVDALAAAEQVLRRDPADSAAYAITIDSGLQVAQRTLERLRGSAQPPDDARRAQAQLIAALMAEVFGPELLVSEEFRTQLARDAIDRYRAARNKRLPDARKPEPKGDPLDLLGGD
ncbi:tetratricopeptide repeat protein [Lysobacter sp. F60174L2]|uniref:tetratricopeptide repeat protein n=1 Tax=Lysobacter sp. F60174L2 TaxID=3459295 RepID=UPI00403DEF8D